MRRLTDPTGAAPTRHRSGPTHNHNHHRGDPCVEPDPAPRRQHPPRVLTPAELTRPGDVLGVTNPNVIYLEASVAMWVDEDYFTPYAAVRLRHRISDLLNS